MFACQRPHLMIQCQNMLQQQLLHGMIPFWCLSMQMQQQHREGEVVLSLALPCRKLQRQQQQQQGLGLPPQGA